MSKQRRIVAVVSVLVSVALAAPAVLAADEPPAEPATIEVRVPSGPSTPGSSVDVTVTLAPKPGILISQYPRVTIKVPAVDGLVAAGEGSVGAEKPFTPEQMEAGENYFEAVEPVRFKLDVDSAAGAGDHRVEGKLRYVYCVKASGFCARKSETVAIPLTVR